MNFASNEEIKFRLNLLGMDNTFLDADLYCVKLDMLRKIFSESALTKIETQNIKSEIPKSNSTHQIGSNLRSFKTMGSLLTKTSSNYENEEKYENISDLYSEMDHDNAIDNEKLFENHYYEFNKANGQYEKLHSQNSHFEQPTSNMTRKISQTSQSSHFTQVTSDQNSQVYQSGPKFSDSSKNYEILSNCKSEQLEKLERIISQMNTPKEKICVKAYKSKMKTKFCKLYEKNSQLTAERTKYKIFHKCKFPNCSRTFASSGWLKSHFEEHLREIKDNEFNKEFEKMLNLFSIK